MFSGSYELLGCKMAFSKGFTCRFCGFKIDKNNIQTDILPLLGTNSDRELYFDIYSQNLPVRREEYEQKYGFKLKCPLISLDNVDVWNIAPPDVLHDLAEGCVSKLFSRFILTSAINLKTAEIISKIEKFNFYFGKFKMRFASKVFIFRKTKAVQVIKYATLQATFTNYRYF